jgi:hypothetical protein
VLILHQHHQQTENILGGGGGYGSPNEHSDVVDIFEISPLSFPTQPNNIGLSNIEFNNNNNKNNSSTINTNTFVLKMSTFNLQTPSHFRVLFLCLSNHHSRYNPMKQITNKQIQKVAHFNELNFYFHSNI